MDWTTEEVYSTKYFFISQFIQEVVLFVRVWYMFNKFNFAQDFDKRKFLRICEITNHVSKVMETLILHVSVSVFHEFFLGN